MEFKTIYTIKDTKAKTAKYCKGCNKEIQQGNVYKLVHQNTGHELPHYNADGSIELIWDCHYSAYIGMYHDECVPDYKNGNSLFDIEIVNITK